MGFMGFVRFSSTRPIRIAGLDRKNRRFPYVGNQVSVDDDETATLIDSAIARWDNRDKVKTFPELVTPSRWRNLKLLSDLLT